MAFNATIGGYHIGEDELYSGVKTSATNTTRGVYFNNDGEFAVGDMNNFLRFYKVSDGTYKLEISANSIKMNTSGSTKPIVVDYDTQFYQSNSPTSLSGGSWTSSSQPTWVDGKYIWMRQLNTYSDGSTGYSPSETGVCITGNSGAKGDTGTSVTVNSTSVTYQASTSGTTPPTGTWTTSVPTVAAGQYLWTKTVVNYSGGKSTTSYSVGRMGQNGSPGSPGSPGAPGEDGNGIKTTSVTFQASSSQTTAPTGTWTSTVPVLTAAKPYLWTRTIWTYDDDTSTTSYTVGSTLEGVVIGGRNLIMKSTEQSAEPTAYPCSVHNLSMQLTEGETYTWSVNANFTNAAKVAMYFGGGSYGTQWAAVPGDGTHTVSATFTASADMAAQTTAHIYVRDSTAQSGAGTSSTDLNWVKLELGNKATDWSPAPEDVDQNILSTSAEQAQAVFDVGKDSIMAQVSQTYYTIDEATGLAKQIADANLAITHTANELNLKFDSYVIQDEFDEVTGSLTDKMDVIDKYIRFVDGDIILGEDGNPVTLKIENDRIAFSENNNEVMYINNEVLNINNAEIKNRLTIANFAFVPRASGNMSIVYTG